MQHKAGFVSIVGKPNVGKSTLMNALIGDRLSSISPKAQTTRHRILGIWNDDHHQIGFSDTPGLLDPAYKLQSNMMSVVDQAMKDADALLYLVEPEEPFNEELIGRLEQLPYPIIVVVNKIDLSDQESLAPKLEAWKDRLPKATVIPVSALHSFNTQELLDVLRQHLPEHPPYFDKEELTDRPVRFFVTELIREKILMHYKKEIPYSVEVRIDEYHEESAMDRIKVTIFVERESQKVIVIGHRGKAIKRMGTDARRAIENFIGKKVYLDITVKVRKDWRNNDRDLEEFGYQ